MFKLQRLEITGFKSFADHTEIVFTGDGITAVVGPNGCGKSNVADAIAWVLGEQRIKHLRGAEMKDVIFQGSRNRSPSGMAEVVLHMVRDETIEHEPDIEDIDSTLEEIDEHAVSLDTLVVDAPSTLEAVVQVEPAPGAEQSEVTVAEDSFEVAAAGAEPLGAEIVSVGSASEPAALKTHHKRHWRPNRIALEFSPGEAVAVTRRLYRSGESEYLLNNRLCRLRDIQDLFSGTGLAGAHYAIIEQGRIGQILSAKPMDRRTLIEEAAGITKFRVRQRAAEARLESARGNLSRVSDIISEIDRQVNSLRRQAAKARRYRIQREELRELLRCVFVAEDRALTAFLEETRTQLELAATEEHALVEQLAEREDDARRATQEARDVEDDLAGARAAAADAELQRDRRAREQTYQQEQVAGLLKRRDEVEREIEKVRERLASVADECERLVEADEKLRAASDERALVLQSAEDSYANRVVEVSQAEAQIERARAELLTHTAVAERLMEIGRQLEAALGRLSLQAEGLAREGERATNLHSQRVAEADALDQEITRERETLTRLVAEREAAFHTVVAGHEKLSETDDELTRAREEYSRVRHRLETMVELDAKRAHYSPVVQRLFATSDASEEFHFKGTLADKLNVDPQWELVVEGAFGSSLQAIIVPTPDDAARAATWLRESNAGRASFLVAGLHGASDEVDIEIYNLRAAAASSGDHRSTVDVPTNTRIRDLLGAPRELLTVLDRTLPNCMNACVTKTLEEAMTISLASGETCVTIEGDWVAGGQLVNAGNARALEEGAGLLAFKRELRELESRAPMLQAGVSAAEDAVSEARARLVELEDTVVVLNEAIGREERDAMARQLNATQLAQEIERAERHLRVVADDAARLAEERLELEERQRTASADASSAEGARQAASSSITEAASVLAVARRTAEAESDALGELRAAAATAAERRRATTAELRRVEAERNDLDARLERHLREITETTEKLDDLGRSIEEMQKRASLVEEERAHEEREIATHSARLMGARERADALSTELAELNRSAAAARDARAALEVQRAESAARLTYVREACMSELNQSLEELSQERPVDDEFDLEAGRARVEDLRSRIEGFGAVNMMALEELSESEERLTFLTEQRQDITDGIASTEEALREIKKRSRERFRNAFEQINLNFGRFFQELFGGGRGEMSLIDEDDVLESGIDIIAQPPGKRLQNVLLLSGGEKAMAALALVLGIFHYRPSPFCLLDEVDAPLDEANVGRFTNKVGEMAANTQFIVITHNKRTMEMARALYGVTMEEAGVSKLVSVKFD
ncbi:MAG: chromosome segregation protein [Acidobacteriota bacterium]|jgi:chromosome segregation protein|nr:chromosome segregation protein [Acidobacteriota bacterium]